MSVSANQTRALHGIPGDHHMQIGVAAALAADATAKVASARMPFKGKIKGAVFIPVVAITGVDTNTRTLTVKKADGTVVATIAFTLGVDATILVPKTMTLTATTADLTIAEDTVLYVESAKGGTGLALPLGTVQLTYTPK